MTISDTGRADTDTLFKHGSLSLGISVSFANTSVFSGVFDSRNRLYLFVVGVYERSWLLFALDVFIVGTIAHTMANIFIPSSVQWIVVKMFSTCGRLSQRTVDQMIHFLWAKLINLNKA